MKSKRLNLLVEVVTILALILTACGGTREQHSETKQLIYGPDSVCDRNMNDVAALKTSYGKYVRSVATTQDLDHAMITLSRIPRRYLDFVFTQSAAQVQLTGPCQGGMTYWTYNHQGRVPTMITSGTYAPGNWCGRTDTFAHEMGHAAYGAVQRNYSNFETTLDRQYNWAVWQSGESQYLAPYARNSREEFFAEIFDQYYCSAAARDLFKRAMPYTYAFAEAFLLPPP